MDPITEAIAHVGALEQRIVELPKAAALARQGGGLVQLAIQREGQRGIDAERELERLHIPIVNRDFDKKNLYLCVKQSQANWAEYVLHRAGFVVTSTPIDPRNACWAAGKGRVPAWSESASRMRVGRGRSHKRAVVIRRREPGRSWLARLVDWIIGGA